MNDPLLLPAPTRPTQIAMADSLEVRLVVAGRLSPTALDVRQDRAELAGVLGQAMRPRADATPRPSSVPAAALPSSR